jgi:uncharacterized protein (TIGR02996 family)
VTSEADFQNALDANPEDHQTRLVFADWLQERGDPRAEGYRALGMNRKSPYIRKRENDLSGPGGWTHTGNRNMPPTHRLSMYWWRLLANGVERNEYWRFHADREHSEDAAALAFTHLSTKRRAALLTGEGTRPRTAKRKMNPKAQAKKPRDKKT